MNYIKRIFSKTPDSAFIQFLRYGFSSGIAFAVDYSIYFALTWFGTNVFVSNTISFILGLVIVYIFSNTWVFTGAKRKNKYIEFIVFASVGIVALGINQAVLFFFYKIVGIHYLISKVIAAGVTIIFNYVLRKTILYSKKAGEES